MRPQDVVVLLKLISLQQQFADTNEAEYVRQTNQGYLAVSLGLSQSEISGSLRRSRLAGLVDETKKQVYRQNLLDFLFFGLAYVFPAAPGAVVRGMPTAHSAPPLKQIIVSDEPYVWPDQEGEERGQAIAPLYAKVPYAARQDPLLYELLTLVDALRVGRAREVKLAREKLQNQLAYAPVS